MYYGGGGLLLILGIVAVLLGYTLVGIVLIAFALFAGGWGLRSRRA